ncbi:uncharacterized protein N7498_001210 [Penicillium cinerascens]|uniref:Zn(2)-C6 fungal-type domain-containing protein n=1 Tax=Penicillium cinerascens TaxID=70096 RepID=A0A9W9TDZ9_9EURO|nr:uncharacterized protein N7498_001210 [Penicillium cinerascens]KAJ5219111.1 hypothetical protein N7498_001210 [Penicillium cinerascens]
MEPSQLQSGTPAPYGRACINCSRAKSKCILLSVGNGCERCQRLKKDCRPSPTVRKRSVRSSASRNAQLEAKLDNIVSLLQTTGASSVPADWESATAKPQSNGLPGPTGAPVGGPIGAYASPGISSPSSAACSLSSIDSIHDICSALPISPEEAEKTLGLMRVQNLKFLPFVYIPPHVTADQLREDKPFFWLCIMAVATTVNIHRELLFRKITMFIHQKLLIEVSPSMDLLLGIMTFISWTTYSRKPFLNFYAHVLMGLVCDLGINQAVTQELSAMQAFKCIVGWKQHIPTVRTLEERRAVLGCFLLTSSIALTMCKIDALRWNPHMEESLSVLLEAKECPEDELLVTLVKIQLIMDKIYHMRRDGDNNKYSLLYTKAFQSQLESVKSQIPQRLQQDKAVLLYLAYAEIVIHEIAIKTTSMPNSPETQRLESLCTCLQASKAWLDHFLAISPDHHIGISFTVFFQFSRALVTLYKLSTLEDPAWDRNMVRSTANVLEILDRILYNLKRSSRIMPDLDNPEYNVYEKGVKMVQSIKQMWEPKLMEVWYPNLPSDEINNQYVQTGPPLPEVMPMTGFDDAWMLEVFGSI